MDGYHVTTPKKIERYKQSGCILPPVRFFPDKYTASRWAKRTGRTIILHIESSVSYPLLDHRPARWTPEVIRSWEEVENG